MALHKRMAGVMALAGLATLAAWSFSRSAAFPPDEQQPRKKGADDGPRSRDYLLLPARREGVLAFVGRELKEGEKAPEGEVRTIEVAGKSLRVVRLKEGDRVQRGQWLGRVDDALCRKEAQIKEVKVQAAEAELRAAQATRDEAKYRLERLQKLHTRGGASEEEVRAAQLTLDRFQEEVKSKEAGVLVARHEVEMARAVLDMHDLRSPVEGVVQALLKHEGEAVRQYDPVFRIKPDQK